MIKTEKKIIIEAGNVKKSFGNFFVLKGGLV